MDQGPQADPGGAQLKAPFAPEDLEWRLSRPSRRKCEASPSPM